MQGYRASPQVTLPAAVSTSSWSAWPWRKKPSSRPSTPSCRSGCRHTLRNDRCPRRQRQNTSSRAGRPLPCSDCPPCTSTARRVPWKRTSGHRSCGWSWGSCPFLHPANPSGDLPQIDSLDQDCTEHRLDAQIQRAWCVRSVPETGWMKRSMCSWMTTATVETFRMEDAMAFWTMVKDCPFPSRNLCNTIASL